MDDKKDVYEKVYAIQTSLYTEIESMLERFHSELHAKLIEVDQNIEKIFIDTSAFDDELR